MRISMRYQDVDAETAWWGGRLFAVSRMSVHKPLHELLVTVAAQSDDLSKRKHGNGYFSMHPACSNRYPKFPDYTPPVREHVGDKPQVLVELGDRFTAPWPRYLRWGAWVATNPLEIFQSQLYPLVCGVTYHVGAKPMSPDHIYTWANNGWATYRLVGPSVPCEWRAEHTHYSYTQDSTGACVFPMTDHHDMPINMVLYEFEQGAYEEPPESVLNLDVNIDELVHKLTNPPLSAPALST